MNKLQKFEESVNQIKGTVTEKQSYRIVNGLSAKEIDKLIGE